jgi:hypothetical protein
MSGGIGNVMYRMHVVCLLSFNVYLLYNFETLACLVFMYYTLYLHLEIYFLLWLIRLFLFLNMNIFSIDCLIWPGLFFKHVQVDLS